MSTYLTAHFTVEEFQAVSNRELTSSQIANARIFAVDLLEPARRALGFPIKITSFVREGDPGAHGRAIAVDFQPCRDVTPAINAADFAQRLEAMFQWLATFKTSSFGKLIHERTHLHATMPGYAGAYGQVLREPSEGSYELAGVFGAVLNAGRELFSGAPRELALLPIALLAAAVWWLSRRGRA